VENSVYSKFDRAGCIILVARCVTL